jgi:hypothetical protein
MLVQTKATLNQTILLSALGLALLLLLAPGRAPAAWAHETITVGGTEVEYGWVNEPPIAGQPNAVVINIAPKGADSGADVDASNLTVEAVFGSERKFLALEPLGENTPGQFIAPMTPTRPGKYTIHLGGSVGSTGFDTDVVPEEVHTPDLVEFPAVAAAEGASSVAPAFGLAGWIGIAGVILGAIGVVLGVIAISRKPAQH